MSSESDSDSTKFEKDYDSDAFSYFALSLLATVLIPWTASKLWNLYTKSKDGRNYEKNTQAAQSKNSYFSEEVEEAEKRKRAWSIKDLSVSEWVFYGLWFLLLITLLTLPTAQKAARKCVPYDVLGLEVGVSERTIYQKWKKLSLKYHPDKNPGNETAAELFVNITKTMKEHIRRVSTTYTLLSRQAKDTLMDETMRRNCEEYDNPDGPVQTKFQWALPSFFLKFPLSTLIVYLLGIPKAETSVDQMAVVEACEENRAKWDLSSDTTTITSFIILYAASAEFEEDLVKIAHKKYGREWRTLVMVLNQKCGKIKIPAPPPVDRNGNRRVHVSDLFAKNSLVQLGTFLLRAHLHRLKLPKAFQPVLKKMLLKSDKLIPRNAAAYSQESLHASAWADVFECPEVPADVGLSVSSQKLALPALIRSSLASFAVNSGVDAEANDFKKRMRKVTSWKVFRSYPEKKVNTIFEVAIAVIIGYNITKTTKKIPEDKAKVMKAYIAKIKAQGTGIFKFRLHLISNTYMGVDIQRDFEIIVGERDEAQEGEEGEEDDEHVEGREQSFLEGLLAYEDGAWGPWYYLWYPNLCALVVDMIALALLAMFIFNFLFSRGYWQDYVSP
eukprot:jgi/Bigna1/84148/fgenesh1_pg.124_\